MKVQIVSMQRVYNHGSFLQAYALKKLLEEISEDVRFEDIIPGISNDNMSEKFAESKNIPFFKDKIIRMLEKIQKKILLYNQRKILKVDFHFGAQVKRDLAVIGSDEMFNCCAPSVWGISKQLFGDIPESKRTVTYAVSCGHTEYKKIPDNAKDYLRNAMQKLQVISVRDSNTERFVKQLTGRTVQYNLDPVLIYEFDNEVIRPRINKPYLLVYSYTNRMCNLKEIAAVKKFAKKHNLITIGAGVFQYWCDMNIPVSPFQLLGYFEYADFIVTDTFHGSVISIKYNKPFVAFVRQSNENKLGDLLKRLGVESRRVDNVEKFETIAETACDYEKTNQFINKERTRTRTYLKKCVDNRLETNI